MISWSWKFVKRFVEVGHYAVQQFFGIIVFYEKQHCVVPLAVSQNKQRIETHIY